MNRRRYLALLGAGIGLPAGCVGRSADEPSTPSRETTTSSSDGRRVGMDETVEVGDRRVTVGSPRVRKAVTTLGVHEPRVLAEAGQFVVADVRVDGSTPDRLDDVALRSSVGGTPLPDGDPLPALDEGGFAFPFPAERHETAAVRWATDERAVSWGLPATTRDALAREPRFSVEELAVPSRDGRLVLELTVANDGERDGRFLAEVSMEAFSGREVVEFSVPVGASRRYSGRAEKMLLYFENNGGGTLTLQYPGPDGMRGRERTVDVPEPTDGANTPPP
ncbi:MAG: hypothetical protein ABEJ61_06440 [Haloferacaceae archaeon]